MKRGLLLLGALLGGLLDGCDRQPAVPDPDLTAAEKPVRDKLTELRKAVLAAPSPATWAHFARTLDAHGFLEDAETAYVQAAVGAESDLAFECLHLAGVAVFESHPDRARDHFEKAIALRARSFATRLHLARLLETLDENDEAKKQYEFVSQAGVSSYALLGLGRIALRAGDAKTAIEHLRRASIADPQNRRIWEALARAYGRLGRKQESRDAAQKAGKVNEYRPFADPLRRKVDAEAVHAVARFRRGTEFARAQKFREAIVEYRAGLAARPDDVLGRFNLARALDLVGEKKEALQHLERVLAAQPGHAGAKALRDKIRGK